MVASPELTCLSIAPPTPFPSLVEFLYELCGRYRLPDGRDSDKHHRGDRKAFEDAIRHNDIEHLGTRVVTLTWG